MYIKLKYIRKSLDIYQHISYHAQNQKKKKKKLTYNILTMKTYQMPNKWQYLTCTEMTFSNQNLQSDTQTVVCQ